MSRKPNRSAGVVRRPHCSGRSFALGWRKVRTGMFARGEVMVRSRNARAASQSGDRLGAGDRPRRVRQLRWVRRIRRLAAAEVVEPAAPPEMPATIRADEIVGRWGLASFQNPNDRARTEEAARGAVQAALCDRRRRLRRRGHASGRPGDAAGTAPEGQPERQELYRSGRPAPASRIARSFRSTAACWSPASSTRMPRSATATWSTSAARRAPER